MLGQFSEFSYGFALAHEICNRAGRLSVAPVLPSLQEEGREGGGYDILIERPGLPLFLQFKLSEYMVRSTAGEWAQFGAPYYRFWLHARRHSDQHDLLCDLDDETAEVLYAAPRFHLNADLNAFFTARAVEGNSIFFAPSELGPMPDDEGHPVAFERNASYGYLYSEPKRIGAFADADGLLVAFEKRAVTDRFVVPTPQLFDRLYQRIVESAGAEAVSFPALKVDGLDDSALLSSRARAAFAARIFVGAELLWVTAP